MLLEILLLYIFAVSRAPHSEIDIFVSYFVFQKKVFLHFIFQKAIDSPEAWKKRVLKYVVPIILISTLWNIPTFFEFKVITKTHMGSDNGVPTQYNRTYLQPTDLRNNPAFIVYYRTWAMLLIMGIIPMFLLICLNYKVLISTCK